MKLCDFNSILGQHRPIQLEGITSHSVSASLWLGRDTHNQPLQICVFESNTSLPDGKMERIWELRRGSSTANILVVALNNDKVDMAGSSNTTRRLATPT
jgi:hypothetical protein